MNWDKSTRPRRLRRKEKRLLLVLSLVISFIFVTLVSLYHEFTQDGAINAVSEKVVNSPAAKKIVKEVITESGRQ